MQGQEIISKPKTEQSIREITIPRFLAKNIEEYIKSLKDYPDDKRIFAISAEALQHTMKRHILMSGVPKIRIHDLRHSHVALLINQNIQPYNLTLLKNAWDMQILELP